MKILLTNDDGFDADGMQELAKSLRTEHECWIVAPDSGRSCCSHGVTNHQQITVRKKDDQGWDVNGTPADCVRVALHSLNLRPDLVISGVNHGGNLGIDTLFSGTVAAAREACIAGYPSIAISQYMRLEIPRDWSQIAHRAHEVLKQIWSRPKSQGKLWNINLPAIAPEDQLGSVPYPIVDCELEPAPLAFELRPASAEQNNADLLRGEKSVSRNSANNDTYTYDYISNYQQRPRSDKFDVAYCFGGHTTVTQLKAFPF